MLDLIVQDKIYCVTGGNSHNGVEQEQIATASNMKHRMFNSSSNLPCSRYCVNCLQ